MPYAEIQPSASLRRWVECFWTRSEDASTGPHSILPDGCADFVFDLTNGEAMAVGTMTRPLIIDGIDSANFLGVRFRPGCAAAFLRIPLAEITDARVSLGDLWRDVECGSGVLALPTALGKQQLPLSIAAASSCRGRGPRLDAAAKKSGSCDLPKGDSDASTPLPHSIVILESALLRRLVPDRDARVDAAISRITTTNARIDDVARDVGISRQHLARQFHHHVGVSPKTFARVMRFRRLLASLPTHDVDWADVALEHGYYDQSHLIDEFRELAGMTPAMFHFSNRERAV